MQDAYVSCQLTWPDVNCASRLCFKGVCKYIVKEEAGITDEWLCQHVTPRISSSFGNRVGATLAKPLLWGAFHPIWSESVHASIRIRIVSEFVRLERDLDDEHGNPVRKVEVIPNEGTKFYHSPVYFYYPLD